MRSQSCARADAPHDAAGHRPGCARPFAHDRFAIAVERRGRKHQRPFGIAAHRRHEGIGHQDGEVEATQLARLLLGGDELLDVGMIAAQRRHHGAAAGAGGQDGAAHRVPDLHEGDRTGGDVAGALARVPRGRSVEKSSPMPPPCCIVIAPSCRARKMPGIEVLDRPHDEAVEQRDVARRAGAGLNATAWKELEILQNAEEAILPGRRHRWARRPRARVQSAARYP